MQAAKRAVAAVPKRAAPSPEELDAAGGGAARNTRRMAMDGGAGGGEEVESELSPPREALREQPRRATRNAGKPSRRCVALLPLVRASVLPFRLTPGCFARSCDGCTKSKPVDEVSFNRALMGQFCSPCMCERTPLLSACCCVRAIRHPDEAAPASAAAS